MPNRNLPKEVPDERLPIEQEAQPPPKLATEYQQRRTQLLDAVILTGVIAILGFAWNTDRNVATLRAEKAADDRIEARDPVIRESRYLTDQAIIRSRVDVNQARIEKLEDRERDGK